MAQSCVIDIKYVRYRQTDGHGMAIPIYQRFDGWLVVLKINVDLAIFQPYLDLEAGENQSLKIQVARPGIKPRSSCSASQELKYKFTIKGLDSLQAITNTESYGFRSYW